VESSTKTEGAAEAPERFLFDRSFDVSAKPAKKPKPEEEKPPEPTFSRKELDAAHHDGYAEGHAAGMEEAAAGIESEIAQLVAAIGEKLPPLSEAQAAANERLLHDGARLATTIARKILPAYSARHGMEEMAALIKQCLGTLIEQPRITVHVGADYVDAVRAQLDSAASASAFEGRFLVEPEAAMGPSDCRIAWQGGGLERDEAEIWRQVDAATENFLARLDAGPTEDNPADTVAGGAHGDETNADETNADEATGDGATAASAAPADAGDDAPPTEDAAETNPAETPDGATAPLEDR
jgi:flagellar biosynthesis/type III secretory pathway protein FliH